MSSPRITMRITRIIGREDGPVQSDCNGSSRLRRLTYEDGTSELFLRGVRIVDLHWVGSIPYPDRHASYIYNLIGEDGVHYSIEVDKDGAIWLGKSFPWKIQR